MNVYLIGDSVRLGYQPFVCDLLRGFTVIVPTENCGDSDSVRQNLAAWTQGIRAGDIVHINCGLHDIRCDEGSRTPLNDVATYRQNLHQIFDYLKQTGAIVIWASSTPFLEKVHNLVKPSRRYLADIQSYNQAAADLAAQYGFVLNDLYSLMFTQDLTALMLCDGLHFNEFGSEMLAKQVAAAISQHAGQS